jgi:hypothetical protein
MEALCREAVVLSFDQWRVCRYHFVFEAEVQTVIMIDCPFSSPVYPS